MYRGCGLGSHALQVAGRDTYSRSKKEFLVRPPQRPPHVRETRKSVLGCTLPGYFTMGRTRRRKRGRRRLSRLNQPLSSKTSARFIRCVRSRNDRQHGAITSRAGVGTAPAQKPDFRPEAKLLRSAESSAKWRHVLLSTSYYTQTGRGYGRISRLTFL